MFDKPFYFSRFTPHFFTHIERAGRYFYVLKYRIAYATYPPVGRTGEHIGKATPSSLYSILLIEMDNLQKLPESPCRSYGFQEDKVFSS